MIYHMKDAASGFSRGAEPTQWLYTTKEDQTWKVRGSPTMAGCRLEKLKTQENCLVCDGGCPSHLNLALKAWRIPREQLIYSLWRSWVWRAVVRDSCNILEVDTLITTGRAGRQAALLFPWTSLYIGCHPEGAAYYEGDFLPSYPSWNVLTDIRKSKSFSWS